MYCVTSSRKSSAKYQDLEISYGIFSVIKPSIFMQQLLKVLKGLHVWSSVYIFFTTLFHFLPSNIYRNEVTNLQSIITPIYTSPTWFSFSKCSTCRFLWSMVFCSVPYSRKFSRAYNTPEQFLLPHPHFSSRQRLPHPHPLMRTRGARVTWSLPLLRNDDVWGKQ